MVGIFQYLLTQLTFGVRVRSLAALVRAVALFRLTLLFLIFGLIAAVMSAISLFMGVAYGIHQYALTGVINPDPLLIFCAVAFLFSLVLFCALMSQRCWLRIFKIDQLIRSLTQRKRA